MPRTLPAPTPPPANTPRERREPLPAPAVIPVLARRELAVPQAPDVHITIGRVDVRAVPAPAPRPAAPPSRRQPLALDAYLSQRQGGRP